MRVRFFEVDGAACGCVLRCDQLPALLGVDRESGRLEENPAGVEPVCRLDDMEGQLLYECLSLAATTLVNNSPLSSGPLLPGDCLSIGGRRFIVSYERTADGPLPETRFRVPALVSRAAAEGNENSAPDRPTRL